MDACDLGYNTKLGRKKKKKRYWNELWPFFFFLFGEQMQTIAKTKKEPTPFVMFRPRMQELLNIEQYCH
jgi:hypothetical protein